MSDPFLGEIKIWAFNWAPRNWLLCDGAELPISQNQALAALLGNAFGGDLRTKFNLPDLRGRTPMGIHAPPDTPSPIYSRGEKVGQEAIVLTAENMPSHQHLVVAYNSDGTQLFPADGYPAAVIPTLPSTPQHFEIYRPVAASQPIPDGKVLAEDSVTLAGASAPLNNMQPFAVVNFCICSSGIFPPRS